MAYGIALAASHFISSDYVPHPPQRVSPLIAEWRSTKYLESQLAPQGRPTPCAVRCHRSRQISVQQT